MRFLRLIFLAMACTALSAEEKPVLSRTLTQFGVFGTLAENQPWSQAGWGFAIRPFFYLDPSAPDGFYLGLLSGAFSHNAGSISLADTRLVTLGWRGNPLALGGPAPVDFQVDLGLSPTMGARISGSSILGSTYAGLGMTLGLYLPVVDGGDLGLSWEPTFPRSPTATSSSTGP